MNATKAAKNNAAHLAHAAKEAWNAAGMPALEAARDAANTELQRVFETLYVHQAHKDSAIAEAEAALDAAVSAYLAAYRALPQWVCSHFLGA